MNKLNYKQSNKVRVGLLNLLLYIFFIGTIIIPSLFILYNPISGIGHFFIDNSILGFCSVLVLVYFLLTGIYTYKIFIDSYIINIKSFRVLELIFKKPNYIDIAHAMLRDYSFFDRPLSFNKTLMLKIETVSGRSITIRFHLSLISEKEIEKISNMLDAIIVKNN